MRKTRTHIFEDRHPEWVVLVCGMGNGARYFADWFQIKHMGKPLAREGFSVVNIDYPSTSFGIATLAEEHIGPAIKAAIPESAERVHFVALSMGGVVVRQLMQSDWRPEKLGRTVMLAAPNQGSEVSDFLKDWWVYRNLMGPAGQELTTAADSVPNSLGPVDFECGVLTGNLCLDPWFGWLFKGQPNDGKVAVERAKVEGMSDFKVTTASHYDIMHRRQSVRDTVAFLRTGKFERVD